MIPLIIKILTAGGQVYSSNTQDTDHKQKKLYTASLEPGQSRSLRTTSDQKAPHPISQNSQWGNPIKSIPFNQSGTHELRGCVSPDRRAACNPTA